MARAEIQIRRADGSDAAAVARLLHDFNTEYSEPTPAVGRLAEIVGAMFEAGEITVLLAGEGPDALAVLRFRTAIWTGPDATYATTVRARGRVW